MKQKQEQEGMLKQEAERQKKLKDNQEQQSGSQKEPEMLPQLDEKAEEQVEAFSQFFKREFLERLFSSHWTHKQSQLSLLQ